MSELEACRGCVSSSCFIAFNRFDWDYCYLHGKYTWLHDFISFSPSIHLLYIRLLTPQIPPKRWNETTVKPTALVLLQWLGAIGDRQPSEVTLKDMDKIDRYQTPTKAWQRESIMTSLSGNISALLALCKGNPPVTGGFPSQRPVTRSFDVFFDLCLNKRLSKQSRRGAFESPSRSFWRHCNACA